MEVQPTLVHRPLVGHVGRIGAKSTYVWSRHDLNLLTSTTSLSAKARRLLGPPADDSASSNAGRRVSASRDGSASRPRWRTRSGPDRMMSRPDLGSVVEHRGADEPRTGPRTCERDR